MPTMTRDKSTDVPEADRDWFGGRRWTGIAAIGVVIVVGLCAIVLFLVHHKNSGTAQGAAPPPSTAPSSAAKHSSPTASPLPTTIPTAAPEGTSWSIYDTVALPSISGLGPERVSGSIATGYARTPIGALLATVNEGIRYQLAPDSEWRAAAAQMLDTTVPGYRAWLKERAAHPYGPQGAAAGDQLSQVAGFQFVSYTPSDAAVQLVTRNSDGSYQVVTEHVTWAAGDWKFVVAPDGGNAANIQQVNDLSGFIEWRGV